MTLNRYLITATCSVALVTGIASLAPTPALAGALKQAPQVTVRYGDLNIAHRAGAESLVGRIRQGAREACGSEPFRADLRGYSMYRACVQKSVDAAVASVDAPLVTEAYRRQFGPSLHVAGN